MNKRILMVVMTAAVVTTTSGCTPFRDFFFGRGAKCGLCNRVSNPFKRQPPATPPPAPCNTGVCNQPTYVQPQYSCNPCGNGYAAPGTVTSACPCDPYSGAIGTGVIYENGQPIYDGTWQPRAMGGYQSNYMGYPEAGYRYDKDGARIVYEDPIPAEAQAVN